jgi:hypothetical protein
MYRNTTTRKENTVKQETMYPTPEQVIDALRRWQVGNAPDYHLVNVHVMGDSIRRFHVTFAGPNVLRMNMTISPGAFVEGWFASDAQVFWAGSGAYENDLTVYPDNLRRLMNMFPQHAIVSIDNEDDAYPVGHPVFGYAAIDDDRNIVAFAAHDHADFDGEDYTYNPFLPRGEVVTDENVMETLTDTESPRIRESWINDEKEWWA